MKRQIFFSILGAVLVIFCSSVGLPSASQEAEGNDVFYISGTVLDSHKEPLRGAIIKILVNGQPQKVLVEDKWMEGAETSSHGTY